jgi:hypothetical protein
MDTIASRPENRRRDTTPPSCDAGQPWLRSEAFAEDLEEAVAEPRHNPRPYWKGSDGVLLEPVLEPIRRAARHGLAGLFGQRLGGARA